MNLTFIKHKDFKDVCLEVLSAFDYGHGIEIKGRYWNLGFVSSWPIRHSSERVNLAKRSDDPSMKKSKKSFIGDWLYLADYPPPDCLRSGSWIHFSPRKPREAEL